MDDSTAGARADRVALRAPRRRRGRRILAALVTASGLLATGLLTHFAVHPDRLATIDKPLMLMQRMGPPPALQDAYEELSSDTAAIKSLSTGRVITTAVYAESLMNPAALPAFGSLLPASFRHVLEAGAAHTYIVIFVAPLTGITSRRLVVDTSSLKLPGAVVGTDEVLGLAAIAVTMTQDQVSALEGPLPSFGLPSAGTLPLLVMRRNPDVFHRSAGFVLTSGGIRDGRAWCDTPVAGTDIGAPLVQVSPSSGLSLVGLAVPASVPGRCSVLGSAAIGRFLLFLASSRTTGPGQTVAYLGVVTESMANARAEAGYQGRQLGVYITSVVLGSPAIEAGLHAGDVIIRIGTEAVNSQATLRSDIRRLRPGSVHLVTFVREGKTHTLRIRFGAIPASEESG
jgi:membrane-associated protease RseP (regulator of RpoE activity)